MTTSHLDATATGTDSTAVRTIALVAAGQGAQSPRMLTPWVKDARARGLLASWSDACGTDLTQLGTTADAMHIARTENTQPLLVAQGLLAGDPLLDAVEPGVEVVMAGHSVGEITAAALAGSLTPREAVWLARQRGLAMSRACAAVATGMAAVVGGDEDVVLALLDHLGLTPANHNGAGQIVAAGTIAAISALVTDPPAGAAVKPLSVAGAFHTAHMAEAQHAFADATTQVTFRDPRHLVISNLDGSIVTSGDDLRQRLIAQITAPVRWDLCLATLAELRPLVVTVPPGRVQAGIIARQLPQLRTLSITIPRELSAALAAVAACSAAPAGVPSGTGAALVGAGV